MRKLSWLIKSVHNPVEMTLFLYSLGLFLFALFLMSPFYVGSPGGSIWPVITGRPAEIGVGLLFLGASLPGLIAPFRPEPNRNRLESRAATMLFLSFLFLGILRILIFGWLPVTWLPLLIEALTCGGLRLFLQVRRG